MMLIVGALSSASVLSGTPPWVVESASPLLFLPGARDIGPGKISWVGSISMKAT